MMTDEWWLDPDQDLYIRYNLDKEEWELEEADQNEKEMHSYWGEQECISRV